MRCCRSCRRSTTNVTGAFWTAATIVAMANTCLAQQQPSIRAPLAETATIRIDGRLDEPVWTNATVVALTQQSPHSGSATPYTTTMRVIADHDKVYIGFTCADPQPERIAIHPMQRDGDMYGD